MMSPPPMRLLSLLDLETGETLWSAVAPNELFATKKTRLDAGIETCVKASDSGRGTSFVALNQWRHQVLVGRTDDSTRVYVIEFQSELPNARSDPWLGFDMVGGRFEVGCGDRFAVAMRSVSNPKRWGGLDWSGVIDIISYGGTVLVRKRLTTQDPIARATSLGIDNDGFVYGLVNEDTRMILIKQAFLDPASVIRLNGGS